MIIALEGTDGSGKATQTRLLKQALRKKGLSVATLNFPRYKNRSSLLVREYLGGVFGTAGEVPPKVASAFFAFDRLQTAAVLRRLTSSHDVIVLDRYVGANKGHQLGKLKSDRDRREFLRWLNDLEYKQHAIPIPDLTLLLYLPTSLVTDHSSSAAKGGVKNDVHESDKNHMADAEAGYLWAAKHDKVEKWRLVPCCDKTGRRLTPDELHARVWSLIF